MAENGNGKNETVLQCLECQKEFFFSESDTHNRNFCNKWCEKKWHDDKYSVEVSDRIPVPTIMIPSSEPFFNIGLGCVTKGTRDAERIAKSRGLTPMGNETVNPEKFERQQKHRDSQELQGILREGAKAASCDKTLDGKPLSRMMTAREKEHHERATGEKL